MSNVESYAEDLANARSKIHDFMSEFFIRYSDTCPREPEVVLLSAYNIKGATYRNHIGVLNEIRTCISEITGHEPCVVDEYYLDPDFATGVRILDLYYHAEHMLDIYDNLIRIDAKLYARKLAEEIMNGEDVIYI